MQIYVENVLKAILKCAPPDWDISVCASGIRERNVHFERCRLIDPTKRARWSLLPIPKTVQEHLLELTGSYPCSQHLRNADIVHSLGGLPLPNKISPIFSTIQDVIPLRLNEGGPSFVESVRRHLTRLAAQSTKIVTISQFSKAEIVDILQVDPAKITVIPNGVDLSRYKQLAPKEHQNADLRLHELGIRRPYLLHLGGAPPRKNAARVVAAFDLLKAQHNVPHQLVFAGANKMIDEVEQKIASSKYKGNIVKKGYLADADALLLLQRADLLVFSSTYEGFGLPPLEAFACGVPVALSNAASLPEVGGQAAVYFEPTNVEDMVRAIYDLISNTALRQRCVEDGLARSAQFTWERNARATLDLYKSS